MQTLEPGWWNFIFFVTGIVLGAVLCAFSRGGAGNGAGRDRALRALQQDERSLLRVYEEIPEDAHSSARALLEDFRKLNGERKERLCTLAADMVSAHDLENSTVVMQLARRR